MATTIRTIKKILRHKKSSASTFIFILLFSAINFRSVVHNLNNKFVKISGDSLFVHDHDEEEEFLQQKLDQKVANVTVTGTTIERREHSKERNLTSTTSPTNNDSICSQGSNDDPVKIVAFTDISFINLALVWYERLTNLGYDSHTIVTIDHESTQYLIDHNRNKSNGEKYRVEQQLVDKGTRRKEMIGSLWYNRLVYCLNQLKNGVSILLTDSDNIFRRYVPTCTFQESKYDAIFAFEIGYPTHIFRKLGFVICGGMTFLKSTNNTIQVLERVIQSCNMSNTSRCNDQAEWNRFSARQMRWFSEDSKAKPNQNGLLQYGFEGESTTVKGFKSKIWDRDFAWRGDFFRTSCPSENNWVAMPLETPFWLEKKYLHFFTRDVEKKKIMRNKVYEVFCDDLTEGLNETINEKLVRAVEIIINQTNNKK